MTNPYNQTSFIDLFSGCGGFSLGLQQSGLKCLAAIDHNSHAIKTFRANHGSDVLALEKDLTRFFPEELAEQVGTKSVDLIIGGPPCQGFSTARQFSGSNSGQRLVDDPRRELYKVFLKFVSFFRPKIFVMENVLGIKKMQNGIYFTAIQNEARAIGYRVAPFEINCWEYGVPQKRVRQLFIGTLATLPIFVPGKLIQRTHSLNPETDGLLEAVNLGEAIEDLPSLEAGDERVVQSYDASLRERYLRKYSGDFLRDVAGAFDSPDLTWHCARPHSERDLRDFSRLLEGETCRTALARGVEMEFPYDRSSFKDRYTRQSRDSLCSTIVAHLKSDGLMFIHPTQVRSFTPREAARVQTFPDWFSFSGTRSHVFTQIGNAVPPLVGRAVGNGIKKYLTKLASTMTAPELTPSEKNQIVSELENFVNDCQIRPIDFVDDAEFREVWRKIHKLLPHLHPESVLDNGKEISRIPNRSVSFCLEPFFIRSGWPVELTPIALEANRRHVSGELDSADYFHA
jgi:DNA (cytosine-5)-methyltransferase 1